MASITGIRTHRSSWYPSSGWTANTSDISVSLQAGPTKDVDTSTTKRRLMTCLKIKTTSGSSINYISKITITANGYRSSSTSGNLIARICSADPSADSTAGDSEAAMEALSISGVSQATALGETTAKDMTFSFVGTFNPNQEYYIIFYTAQKNVMYLFTKDIKSFSITDVSVQNQTYTIAYNANGGSGSTSSQTQTSGTTVNLSSNNFTAPKNAKNSLTIKDGNTTLTTNTYAKFSKNSFNCWTIDNEDYAAGAQYTITKDVTAYAKWNTVYTLQGKTLTKASTTKDGYTITYNANGGICNKTSETMTNTTEYTHNGWSDGTNSYENSGDITISSNTTITSVYTENTVSGSTELPTPIKGSSQDKNVTLYFHGAIESETLTITYQKANSYEFKGWGESRNSSSGVTGKYTPLKNITLYALWGTSLEIAYTTISLPTPTRKGFTFMGWALTEDASSGVFGEYTPETEITALHAIWKPNGAVRIQANDLEGYKIALVYAQYENKWRQLIPYISDGNRWYLIGG